MMTHLSSRVTIWICLFGSCAAAQSFGPEQIVRITNPRERFDNRWSYVWEDLDRDHRLDLLVVSPKGDVRVYYQGPSGFGAQPDQMWTMPPETLWFTVADVAGDPGKEIVISAGDGLKFYPPQKSRGFETSPVLLVPAPQAFQGRVVGSVVFLAADGSPGAFEAGKTGLPVILRDGTRAFVRCGPEAPQIGRQESLTWSYGFSPGRRADWNLGDTASYGVQVQRRAMAWSEAAPTAVTRTHVAFMEGIQSVQDLVSVGLRGTEKADVNGDGQLDEVRWTVSGMIEPSTMIEVFCADRAGRRPEQPTQVLRCRGIPFVQEDRGHGGFNPSLLRDVNGDHWPDIVLLELRSKAVSSSSLLEILVSNEIKWTLAVRSCRAGAGFPALADTSLDVAAMLNLTSLMDMVVLADDMNGDGRPEVLVRTDPSRVAVYSSSATGPLYASGRMSPCRIATQGRPVARDIDGDGLADIYVTNFEKGEVGVVYQRME